MYKKKSKNSNYILIGVVVVMVILITVSLLSQNNGNDKKNFFKNTSMFIDKIIMYPFVALNNEKKVTQSESYTIQKKKNKELESEVQELKDLLELNKTLTEYKPINATVLSRNRSYWFNTITIDKGSKSGIDLDMAVITRGGLVGKISKVSKNSSEVKLITADDINYKVSVSIKCNGVDYYGILNGYNPETGLIDVSGIDKTYPINVGDEVITSGLGELFPSGIFIGNVEDITTDKYDLTKTIHVRTKQNFNSIHYVTVLKVIE